MTEPGVAEARNAAAAAPIETDALVVGAGPVGLFQVFELGLQEIRCQVVDALPEAGGQCIELYPDKPIYDIPGIARCSGRELTARLLEQIRPLGAAFHFGQLVSGLRRRDDGRFDVETSSGTRFVATTVVIAAGVGAFQPKRLKLDGLERFEGTQLHYRAPSPEALAGREVVVVGGADAALEAAAAWAAPDAPQRPASVTLVHRRDAFQAGPALVARVQALRDAGQLRFVAGQPSGFGVEQARLATLALLDPEGDTQALPLDALVVLQGLSPKLGAVADWGLEIERKQLVVDPARFETREPGLFAVGDIVTYPGKRKLIVCGFHEATLAAFAAAPYVHPERPVQLLYTTTSPRLHKVLGVEGTEAGTGP